MINRNEDHVAGTSLFDYCAHSLLHNWVWQELKTYWVFEDIDFGDEETEQMFQKHRLKTIKANWRFILLVLKLKFLVIAACFQFQQEYVSNFEKFTPVTMFFLLFVLKYFIYTNDFVARYGSIFYIFCFGCFMTNINLEVIQFRLYEGFLFHISVSFLLSTCLLSDWRISSVAILMVYSNLCIMLKTFYDQMPNSVLLALIFSCTAFCFNAFLISRNYKQEFLSSHKAKQASSQLKKILKGLPEGVVIMDEQGGQLKLINKKLKQTFNLSLFYKSQKESIELSRVQDEINESFDKIYSKKNAGGTDLKDNKKYLENIFNHFIIKISKDRVEEGKGNDPDVQIRQYQEMPLPLFLNDERKLCQDDIDNERSTKVSISYSKKHICREVEFLKRDFVVKTAKINMTEVRDSKPTFNHMFIDTTQIIQLEEAKAQSNYQRQMLSNVSHEFRTPLNAMSLSLLLMKPYINEDLSKFHMIATSSCDILKGLVEDILDFSKIEAGVFEVQESEFTFSQLFDEAKSIFEMQTQMKGISLNFQMEDMLADLVVKSDKQRLKQILLNLLSNSLKFTDRGFINVELKIQRLQRIRRETLENSDMSITLPSELLDEISVCNILFGSNNYQFKAQPSRFDRMAIDPCRGDKTTGRICQREGDDSLSSEFTKELKVELSVTDTGIGIPECDLPSLFKVFGKTRSNHNRNQTGTGLGLTICKKLCEKLGGKISLKSKEGLGTKVTCSFICFY
ncbi:unnamed protein product [Moneuplotes crassus]|uniref:Histidine kinase domain-containing protein n=1 Tax=Euplotes crassus TaxID=5936 RepID=A0AAD1Y944_EUPCR|nr:unnamed protein product [Moneuplotes crassus]